MEECHGAEFFAEDYFSAEYCHEDYHAEHGHEDRYDTGCFGGCEAEGERRL